MLMKACLRELGPIYNTARMVQEYTRRFYYPALESAQHFSANDHEHGRAYATWLQHLKAHWDTLSIGGVVANVNSEMRVGDMVDITAEIFLGALTPEDVSVQLYEGVLDRQGEIERGRAHEMEHESNNADLEGWHQYRVEFAAETTGRHGYTVRVLPDHPDMRRIMQLGLITWASQK
jgi:starch phosphorylase